MGLLQEALVIQHIRYVDGLPEIDNRIAPEYTLETLHEEQSSSRLMLRISRVVE